MEEIWKKCYGYEEIAEISNKGRIRTFDRYVKSSFNAMRLNKGRVLKLSSDKNGYLLVGFSIDNKQKTEKVHRLVLKTFKYINNHKTMDVNHVDGNKSNNELNNLEWATHKENINHAIDAGLIVFNKMDKKECMFCGKLFQPSRSKAKYCSNNCKNKHTQSKRKEEGFPPKPDKEELYELLLKKRSFIEVGRIFGVTDNTIRKWCKKYGIPSRTSDYGRRKIHKKTPRSDRKLSEEDVRYIRDNYVSGSRGENGATSLARKFGIDRTGILSIVRRGSYKDIE